MKSVLPPAASFLSRSHVCTQVRVTMTPVLQESWHLPIRGTLVDGVDADLYT